MSGTDDNQKSKWTIKAKTGGELPSSPTTPPPPRPASAAPPPRVYMPPAVRSEETLTADAEPVIEPTQRPDGRPGLRFKDLPPPPASMDPLNNPVVQRYGLPTGRDPGIWIRRILSTLLAVVFVAGLALIILFFAPFKSESPAIGTVRAAHAVMQRLNPGAPDPAVINDLQTTAAGLPTGDEWREIRAGLLTARGLALIQSGEIARGMPLCEEVSLRFSDTRYAPLAVFSNMTAVCSTCAGQGRVAPADNLRGPDTPPRPLGTGQPAQICRTCNGSGRLVDIEIVRANLTACRDRFVGETGRQLRLRDLMARLRRWQDSLRKATGGAPQG